MNPGLILNFTEAWCAMHVLILNFTEAWCAMHGLILNCTEAWCAMHGLILNFTVAWCSMHGLILIFTMAWCACHAWLNPDFQLPMFWAEFLYLEYAVILKFPVTFLFERYCITDHNTQTLTTPETNTSDITNSRERQHANTTSRPRRNEVIPAILIWVHFNVNFLVAGRLPQLTLIDVDSTISAADRIPCGGAKDRTHADTIFALLPSPTHHSPTLLWITQAKEINLNICFRLDDVIMMWFPLYFYEEKFHCKTEEIS